MDQEVRALTMHILWKMFQLCNGHICSFPGAF
uniref:Uncharacterized protein n=1 Tax=Rhizophora mucronata TaxID=61149 RepID=A0A2P2N023_RHIMU